MKLVKIDDVIIGRLRSLFEIMDACNDQDEQWKQAASDAVAIM